MRTSRQSWKVENCVFEEKMEDIVGGSPLCHHPQAREGYPFKLRQFLGGKVCKISLNLLSHEVTIQTLFKSFDTSVES